MSIAAKRIAALTDRMRAAADTAKADTIPYISARYYCEL
jgi:hypothetical protein